MAKVSNWLRVAGAVGVAVVGSGVAGKVELPEGCKVEKPVHMLFILDETFSMQKQWGTMKKQMQKSIEEIESQIPGSRYSFFTLGKYEDGCNKAGYGLDKKDAIKAVSKLNNYRSSTVNYPATWEEAMATGKYTEPAPETRNSAQAEASVWCSLEAVDTILDKEKKIMSDRYRQGLTIITDDVPLLNELRARPGKKAWPREFKKGKIPECDDDFNDYEYPNLDIYYDMLQKYDITPFYVIGTGDRGALMNYWWKDQLRSHGLDPDVYYSFFNPNGDGISKTVSNALITLTCETTTTTTTTVPTTTPKTTVPETTTPEPTVPEPTTTTLIPTNEETQAPTTEAPTTEAPTSGAPMTLPAPIGTTEVPEDKKEKCCKVCAERRKNPRNPFA